MPRADLVGRQALVTEEDRQRQIGAAGMIDADEGGVGDDVEALLAAIVGMRAPADIGEQAGGVPQPLSRSVSGRPTDSMNRLGPGQQLLAMAGRAGAQQVELLGRRDQRIEPLRRRVELSIEQALAHAEGRNRDLASGCPGG